jgi:hypothetical protein
MDTGEVMEGLPELTGSEHVPEGHESEENGNLRLAEPPPFVLHQQPIEGLYFIFSYSTYSLSKKLYTCCL